MSGLVFVDAPAAPETFNVLLYGGAGSGKSTAAATAPGPILWVNAEGPGALAYPRRVAADRGSEIHEVRILRTVSPRPILRDVLLHVRERREPIVQTVVVDTVAKVRDGLVRDMVTPGSRDSRNQYGEVAKVLEEFVLILRDLPVNLVLICHEDIAEAEDSMIVQPLIGGALTPKIPAEMDVVAYCGVSPHPETGVIRYLGQLVADKGRGAKARDGGALGRVRPLDLSEWLSVYREALTPKPVAGAACIRADPCSCPDPDSEDGSGLDGDCPVHGVVDETDGGESGGD